VCSVRECVCSARLWRACGVLVSRAQARSLEELGYALEGDSWSERSQWQIMVQSARSDVDYCGQPTTRSNPQLPARTSMAKHGQANRPLHPRTGLLLTMLAVLFVRRDRQHQAPADAGAQRCTPSWPMIYLAALVIHTGKSAKMHSQEHVLAL